MSADPEIQALVSLLADEDPKITGMVWDHLARRGSAAISALREACEAPDPRLRMRARHALRLLALDQVERDLQEIGSAVDDLDFDLEAALHALARIEYPELRREEITWPLNDMAARIRPRLAEAEATTEEIAAIGDILDGRARPAGQAFDWTDLEATCLNKVIERRRGMPVLMAALYLFVAKRLYIPCVGVSLPNHFLVLHRPLADALFIDPSQGCRILNRRQIYHYYLRDYVPNDDSIRTVGARDMAIRALRGMLLAYSSHQDKTRVRRLSRLLEILQHRDRIR